MFLSFYTFILIWILQISDGVNCNKHQQFQPLTNKQTLQRPGRFIKIENESRNDEEYDEAKVFENIQEAMPQSSSMKPSTILVNGNQVEVFSDLRVVLQKLLNKLNNIDKDRSKKDSKKLIITSSSLAALQELKEGKRTKNTLRQPRWGEWTPWSACSVSCGKGREIRWRHCREECDIAETEMEEKTCQLPACGPGKIFGIKL